MTPALDRLARLRRWLFDEGVMRIVSNSSWLILGTALSAAVGMVQVAVVTRELGKDAYGRLVLLMSIAAAARQILGVRVWEWVMKEFAAAKATQGAAAAASVMRTGYLLSLAVNAAAFLSIVVLSPLLTAKFLRDPSLIWLVILYATSLLVNWVADVSVAVQRIMGRFRFLALQGLAFNVMRLGTTVSALLISRSLFAMVAAGCLFELLSAIWAVSSANRSFRSGFGVGWWRAARGTQYRHPGMWRLLAIGSLTDTLRLVGSRADVLVLAWFHTPAVVSVYQAANNVIDGVNRLSSPVLMATFSDLAHLGAERKGGALVRLLFKVSLLNGALAGAGCLTLYVLAPWLVHHIYGPEFSAAIGVLQVLAWVPMWLVGIWTQAATTSIGKPFWSVEGILLSTAIKLLALFTLVPSYGAVGLAFAQLAYAATHVLLVPVYFLRIRRYVHSPAFAGPTELPAA